MIPYLESLFEVMLAKRPIQLLYQQMHLREEFYPKACFDGSLEMLKIPLSSPDLFERARRCCDDSVYGVQGSFRKLELD